MYTRPSWGKLAIMIECAMLCAASSLDPRNADRHQEELLHMNMTRTILRMIGRLKWVAIAVLLLAFGWVVFAVPSGAQSTAVVRVQGPPTPVAPGQPFVVDIVIENAANLGAFEFVVNFDPAIVSASAENIQLGSLLGSTGRTASALRMNSAPNQPDMPIFGAYSYGATSGPNGNGVLATVVMTALSAGTSQLSVSELIITDVTGDTQQYSVFAGSVIVGELPPGTNSLYLPLVQRSSNDLKAPFLPSKP